MKRLFVGIVAIGIAAVIWIPTLHNFYSADLSEYHSEKEVPIKAKLIASRFMDAWSDPNLREQEIKKIRESNAEWDFMGRSFLVWSLANICLKDPIYKPAAIEVMDYIIDETIRLDEEEDVYQFLMPYAHRKEFVIQPARSHFVDGEIALMLAVRRVVEEKQEYKELLSERVNIMVDRMKRSPVLSAESYPDENWTFCNLISLAAIKISDYLDGTDHSKFLNAWVTVAKEKLVDKQTGLLIASYNFEGDRIYGPEGTTLWMSAHCLQLIDEDFAINQYLHAKRELARHMSGFGFSREWPKVHQGYKDVDSAQVIPGIEASVGATGLALIGAMSFKDFEYAEDLLKSLEFSGFPVEKDGTLKYCSSNWVGDTALLYAMVVGPVWDKVKQGAVSRKQSIALPTSSLAKSSILDSRGEEGVK